MPDLVATTAQLRLLSDATRVRLLAVLGEFELSVADLTGLFDVAQSRVSTHLGLLREAGLLRSRRDGASVFYRREQPLPADFAPLWAVVGCADDAAFREDLARARALVAARAGKWADRSAGKMARQYSPGRTWEAAARSLVGLATLGDVLDVASGDGALAELLVGRARTVTCLDLSPPVVQSGAQRLGGLQNLSFVHGDMHQMPFGEAAFDAVLLTSALDVSPDPAKLLQECARVLRPAGVVSGATLFRHDHADAVAPYDHVQLGFDPEALAAMLTGSGFIVDFCALTLRETRPPQFGVVHFHARLPPG